MGASSNLRGKETQGLRVQLFGPIQVEVDGKAISGYRSLKTLQLLALLALRHGREVERQWLAGTLWCESDDPHALAALRVTLLDLRKSLGIEAWRIRSCGARTVLLDLQDADCDVKAFDECIKAGRIEEAAEVWRGQLLEGWYDDWILPERTRREERALEGLTLIAESAFEAGDFARCEGSASKAMNIDPHRESLVRLRMRALAADGRFAAACQVFRSFRESLILVVGCEPEAETAELDRCFRSQSAANRASSQPKPVDCPKERVHAALHETRARMADSPYSSEFLDRKLRFVFDLVERSRPELSGPAQKEWLRQLHDEQQAIRSALAWSIVGGAGDDGFDRLKMGIRTCASLSRFWTHAGHLEEGFEWFCQLSALAEFSGSNSCAHLYSAFGKVAEELGEYERAESIQVKAVTFARQAGDRASEGAALIRLANLALERGDISRSKILAVQSLRIAHRMGDRALVDDCYTTLGLCEAQAGNWLKAKRYLTRSLRIEQELKDLAGIGTGINNLGILARYQAHHAKALNLHRNALQISLFVGHFSEVEEELEAIGSICFVGGKPHHAVQLWAAAAAIRNDCRVFRHSCGREGIDRAIASARETLRARAFDQNYRQGWEMGAEEACSLASGPDAWLTKASPEHFLEGASRPPWM